MSVDPSLANYFDTSRKLERENAELIAELRAVLLDVLASGIYVSTESTLNVAHDIISKSLHDRALDVLEASE